MCLRNTVIFRSLENRIERALKKKERPPDDKTGQSEAELVRWRATRTRITGPTPDARVHNPFAGITSKRPRAVHPSLPLAASSPLPERHPITPDEDVTNEKKVSKNRKHSIICIQPPLPPPGRTTERVWTR